MSASMRRRFPPAFCVMWHLCRLTVVSQSSSVCCATPPCCLAYVVQTRAITFLHSLNHKPLPLHLSPPLPPFSPRQKANRCPGVGGRLLRVQPVQGLRPAHGDHVWPPRGVRRAQGSWRKFLNRTFLMRSCEEHGHGLQPPFLRRAGKSEFIAHPFARYRVAMRV